MHKSFPAALTTLLIAGCATSMSVPDAARSGVGSDGQASRRNEPRQYVVHDQGRRDRRTARRERGLDARAGVASRRSSGIRRLRYPGRRRGCGGKGTWDVAILAIEPARAQKIAFSPAITEIEATYAVHLDSALRSVAQVDTSGIRIAAPEKAGYELYLTRTLRNATLIRTKGFQASIDLFNERRADALAGLKPALLESMDKVPNARLLEGKFMTVNHGLRHPPRAACGGGVSEGIRRRDECVRVRRALDRAARREGAFAREVSNCDVTPNHSLNRGRSWRACGPSVVAPVSFGPLGVYETAREAAY